ncbi:MAG: ATP-dependent Clp protease ATP-binding subunit, partial [Oscillospiraceae bacterium]|nr:ATP-dependent Clp protease ATP-binding subunit [Oscillospiraceae bacterium]
MRSNEKFSQRAETAIENARGAARDLGHSTVGTEHLLLGILAERESLGARVLLRRGLEGPALRRALTELYGCGAPGGPVLGLSEHARQAMETAAVEAESLRQGFIGTEHLLLGILRQPDCGGAAVLRSAGADLNDIYTDIVAIFGRPASGGRQQLGSLGRTARRVETRVLDQYSRDLTALAAAGHIDPVVSRGEEIRRAVQILSRRS